MVVVGDPRALFFDGFIFDVIGKVSSGCAVDGPVSLNVIEARP